MHARRAQAGTCAFAYSDVPPPPLIRQHKDVNIGATVNPAREAEFKHRFKAYGCSVVLHEASNARWSYWTVEDTKTGAQQSSAFDSDMLLLLTRLSEGHKLEHISLIPHDTTVATSTSTTKNRCAVCGELGGLPCPAMLGKALGFHIRLELKPDDWIRNAYHVHPGRCRKRLKQLLDTATQLGPAVK